MKVAADNKERCINFTICICTRNRPDALRRALCSVYRSKVPASEIIVSDDSTDLLTREMMAAEFPQVIYLAGSRKGLSANRNNAIAAVVAGTHVLFIDDDAELGEEFLGIVLANLIRHEEAYDYKLIVTGTEKQQSAIISPHDQTFLGFQRKSYRDKDNIRTIVINSTVFPIRLLKQLLFDEQLIYGYEEVDFATRAVAEGYTIVLLEDAVNMHEPSEINRDSYNRHIASSRIYVTYKRYAFTEGKPLKAASFLTIAVVHYMLHCCKKEGIKGLIGSVKPVQSSLHYISNYKS